MSDLTAKFEAFEAQVADQHTALLAAIASLQDAIDLVASNTDIALENGAANTKALLAALGQTSGCFPCPTPSISVPPIDSTPVAINSELCQRSQWIVATLHSILANMDTLQSFNVIGTFNVLNDAISEIVGAIAAGDTIPLPSFPETVNIVGDYVSYAGERLFSGIGLIDQFSPLEGALTNAIYSSGDAAGAQAAYTSIIEGSGVSNGARLLFEALAYNALWTYAFDPASTPDLSAFDGEVCSLASGTCYTMDLATTHYDNGSTQEAVTVPFGTFTPETAITTTSGVVTSDNPNFFNGNLAGWTWEVLIGSAFITYRTGNLTSGGFLNDTSLQGVDGVPDAAPSPTGSFFIRGSAGARVRFCYNP